jgi:hypothetical protein
VVVAAADEAHERLPRVLAEHAHAAKRGRAPAKICIGVAPLAVERGEVEVEGKVVAQEGLGIVGGGG